MIILYFTKRFIDRGSKFLVDLISRNQLHFLLVNIRKYFNCTLGGEVRRSIFSWRQSERLAGN